MPINTIIVDDLEDDLERIKRLIANFFRHNIEIIGSANSVDTASELIINCSERIDLVILDMQLNIDGHEDGFDLLYRLKTKFGNLPFKFVVITSHPNEYSVEWSNLNHVFPEYLGFIVKWKYKEQSLKRQFADVLEKYGSEKILIRNFKGEDYPILKNRIQFIQADDTTTTLFFEKDKQQRCSSPLSYWSKELCEGDEVGSFFKCHRSYIVNQRKIHAFRNAKPGESPRPHGGFAIMKNGREVPISNTDNRDRMRQWQENNS